MFRIGLIALMSTVTLVRAAEPVIQLTPDHKAIEVRAAGLTASAAERLQVTVGTETTPIPGQAEVKDGVLRFLPRFPFTPGVTYTVRFDRTTANITVPRPKLVPSTKVVAVDPGLDRLPENTLRLYIRFSAPMSRGDVYKHIHLMQGTKEVDAPFLELGEELWSADSTRFTLLFDPGRVKRGLKPREEVGPSLEEGKSYTLVVDRAWEDENGVPLVDAYRKSFKVGPPDDKGVDPEQWKITTEKGVEVRFEKALDRALAERMIRVIGPDGKPWNGTTSASASGDRLRLGDEKTTWAPGTYKLVIDTRLEDPCGNRVGESFEIDVFKPVTKAIVGKSVEKTFVIK